MSKPNFAIHAVLISGLALAVTSCGSPKPSNIEPVYDTLTGKLQLLKFDSNDNGKVDTWSHMDGAQVVRVEIDSDEDGVVDRWEYYNKAQTIEKVGISLGRDGKEDAWSYTGPDGSVERVEISTKRDGTITRVEHYQKSLLVRAEEFSDEDSMPDKWETYDAGSLTAVAFDTTHRGAPDRRLIYGTDGSVRLEVDAAGDGHFVAPTALATPSAPRDTQQREGL